MSDIKVDGFKSSELLASLKETYDKLSEGERKDLVKKNNAIFELRIKNAAGKEEAWTIDMKKASTVLKGEAKPKADVTISFSDDTFLDIANGKLTGQKAFMSGKLKTKGNMMLATKLQGVLKAGQDGAKL